MSVNKIGKNNFENWLHIFCAMDKIFFVFEEITSIMRHTVHVSINL